MTSYTYQTLGSNQIRLLTLFPGADRDELRAGLTIANLNEVAENASYETLSYTWGDLPATKKVYLRDSASCDVRVEIKDNLYHALRSFRHPQDPRNLWIDALCIDQSNKEEQSSQIPLMRRIYEGSIQTLVWLGVGTSESRPAMSLARALTRAWRNCDGNVPRISSFNSAELKHHGLPSLFSTDYVKLLTMLEQPWFSRAWIVQEVTVSKRSTLFWGNETIEWQDLVMAIDFALRAELPFALHPAVNRFLPIAEEAARYRAGSCKLLSVLLRHRFCAATEPYDKVYAFLGLTEKGHGNFIDIRIDYQQDLINCYVDVARQIVMHDQSLDLLSAAATPSALLIEGLPSWVPDWSPSAGAALRQTVKGEAVSLANAENAGSRKAPNFNAAGSTLHTLRASPDARALAVGGHCFDAVVAVEASYESFHLPSGSMMNIPNLTTELAKLVSSFFQSKGVIMQWENAIGLPDINSHTPQYPTGEDLIDAFFQTLMLGNIAPGEDKTQIRQEYLAWSHLQRPLPILDRFKLGYLQTAVSAAKSLAASVVTQDAPALFPRRVHHIIFRRFVQTQLGYMGLASGNVQVGDQVWLLKGSKVPVVLRSTGHSNNWTLIGDAYVHGIMYGSKFEEAKCSQIMLV